MEDRGSKEIYIREMTCADIGEAAALERRVFSEPWSEKGFEDALSMGGNLFLVAVIDNGEADEGRLCADGDKSRLSGHIAGYCGLYIAGDEGEITNVAVAEPCRRRGIGDAMMSELRIRSGQRGVLRLFLEVRVSNMPAIRLYEKHGFVPCGMRRDFYRQPTEDALCMCCDAGGKSMQSMNL